MQVIYRPTWLSASIWQDPEATRRRAYLRVTLRYSVAGGGVERETLARALETALPGEEQAMNTWLEDLIAAGREAGLARGREIARHQLLLVLRHRFGEMPDPVCGRLEAVDLPRLEHLTNVALTAASLDLFVQALDVDTGETIGQALLDSSVAVQSAPP